MKTFSKKFTALLCTLAILLCMPVCAFADSDGTTAKAIRFNADGKLKIMHVTDTHLSMENIEDSLYLIGAACDTEQPDIVIITGDNAMSGTLDELYCKTGALMNVFESRGIPVAVTFGNHDTENGLITREDLMAYYNTFSCSISVDDGDLLPNCGTYNIPVLGSSDDNVKFNLWVFDSGDYDGEHHYANVLEEQVEWYKAKSEALEAAAGGKVYSLAFQHIIVPEIYDALREVKIPGAFTYPHIYDSSRHFAFDPARENHGMLHEYPCPGYYNHGQFGAMVERGDVLAIFSGHDHTNDFSVNYEGIDIVNSLSTRYNGETFSTQYGYRIITVDENDPSVYETQSIHWYDFCKNSSAFADNVKLAAQLRFLGFFQKFFQRFAVYIVEIFTGRPVYIPY